MSFSFHQRSNCSLRERSSVTSSLNQGSSTRLA
jgi:hypothetical protein